MDIKLVEIAGQIYGWADAKAISLDEKARHVRDSWYARFQPRNKVDVPAMPTDAWVKEVFDDVIIIETSEGLLSYPYTEGDDGLEFGEPTKVEIEYRPAGQIERKEKKKSMAVKALREEDGGLVVGGPLLLFGDSDHKDLGEDYFTSETELWLKRYPSVPALFHHGLDDTVGLAVMGHRVKAEVRDDGVWVEDWLDTSNKFWALVKPLLDAEALYYSPGSAPHLVKREEDGKLKSFPIVEDTLTPIPMQHRLLPIERVTAAYKSAGLELPEELPEPDDGGDDAGAPCQDELEVARAKAEIDILLTEIDMEV